MANPSDALVSEIRSRLSALGFELVDIRHRGAGKRSSLQIRIDRPDSAPGRGVTANDCATVSRALEPWLDESGVLGTGYVLEVSSPGIERPIRWPEHWERFTGHDVRVRIPGAGRIRATIVKVVDREAVVLRPAGGEDLTVPLDQTQDATLVVDWSQVDRSVTRTSRKEKS